MDEGLFGHLPDQRGPELVSGVGRPRLREPVRDQIELRSVDLDSLIGADHPVRLFWAYVSALELGVLEDAIKSREGHAGHPAASPRLLLALWLFATSEGIGSARALDALCRSHDAYRWLCGGVGLNYHTLADFRVAHGRLLDERLTQSVVALAEAGLIDLASVSHDGMRVRASAGAASFRRRATLDRQLAQARDLVVRLKAEVDADPAISRTRMQAARERVARERQARLEQALAKLAEIEAARAPKRAATPPDGETVPAETVPAADAAGSDSDAVAKPAKAPRVSTTDPQARVIKMADGGFRPAYNAQVTTASGSPIIVGLDICASSSDRGLLKPALQQAAQRYGVMPGVCLADGGFNAKEDIAWAAAQGSAVFIPPLKSKHGTDPYRARRDDGTGIAAWRQRMASPAGQARYKQRAITECVHGRMRQNNPHQFTVRGMIKAKSVMLLHALANNILQGHRMIREAGWRPAAT